MIRLISWIFMISLVFMASSHTTFETGSASFLNASTISVSPANESENQSSEIPPTSSTEISSVEKDSHLKSGINADTDQKQENTSPALEVTTANKLISMSLKTHVPEPAYLGETSTAFHSSTSNIKESVPDEEHQETSSPSHSDKNLYYDSRTTTEYGISHEISADSPDLISDDFTEKTTSSMSLITEQTKQMVDEEIKETVVDDHKSTESEIGHFLNDKESETVPSEHESKAEYSDFTEVSGMNFNSQTQKATTEVDSLNKKPKEDLAFEESSRAFFEKSTPNMEETSFSFVKYYEQPEDALKTFNPLEESRKSMEVTPDKELFATDHNIPHIHNSENTSADATEANINATRNPKRIQGGEQRYSDVIDRVRPLYPDPVNSPRSPIDTIRPYRPDTPLYKYPYHRPNNESRAPINKEDSDLAQTSRSGYQYPRVTFKPNYSYSKPSQNGTGSSSTSDSNASKPYRPSLSHPYVPQGSFGRPYRPDFHRPSSKPVEEYSLTSKTTETKGASSLESSESEYSRVDFDYTKLSEFASGNTRPSYLKPESGKPYRPTYNTEISMHSKPSQPEDSENHDSVKVVKPDRVGNRPSSFNPRPGFGNKYQNPDLSLRPFSAGTISLSKNLTRVEYIKADCFDNHMKVTMRFNGTFNGLVYSSGYAQDSSCSYVNGSGRNHYEFYIRLNRCGTLGQQEVNEERLRSASRRRQERAQYLVNTVTVQYSPLIEEDIDEHFRVTCEYGYDFWKTVSFPIINVESAAVKVRDGNPVVFTLPPPQCNMEVRLGSGPSGARVSGPVNVGDPLTLVIHMKSESSGFDILVSNCVAHNGAQRRITLIDSHGCVADERMVSPFKGTSYPDRSQQVTLYSYLKAFRFTGSPALYIECDVRMCHGSCPPQRCYWRHLYKRSAEEIVAEENTTETSNYISDSISLYQALEVRHDEADLPYLLALQNKDELDLDNMVCMRAGGFAAMLAGLLVLLITTTFTSVLMCIRMRKMKKFMQGPDIRRFTDFDGHVPLK